MIAKLETEGQCKILRVSGRVDFESALDFEQQINSMIQQDGDCFIIELSEVELLSSAGLRVLLSTAKRVSHRDASLGLAAPSQVVRQVFEISHFNLLFKIFPSVAEAIAALKAPRHEAESDAGSAASAGREKNAEKALPLTNKPPPFPSPGHQAVRQRSEQESAGAVPGRAPDAPQTQSAAKPDQKVQVETAETPPAAPRLPVAQAVPPIASVPPPVPLTPPARSTSPPPETVPPTVQPPPLPKFPTPPPSAETVPHPARQATPQQIPRADDTLPPRLPIQTTPPLARPQRPSQVAGEQPPKSGPLARQISAPTPLTGAETSVPAAPPPLPTTAQRAAAPPQRVEASVPALLELRAEGNSYPCKDGDVIGSAGELGRSYFAQIPGLAPRHLLIGKLEGRWFVFTPQNVLHPFLFDGHPLVAGERKFLQFAEHQMEFSGHVFGLRLIPEQKKQGFFSRFFGKK
jgi:anti-anti-sigma factor